MASGVSYSSRRRRIRKCREAILRDIGMIGPTHSTSDLRVPQEHRFTLSNVSSGSGAPEDLQRINQAPEYPLVPQNHGSIEPTDAEHTEAHQHTEAQPTEPNASAVDDGPSNPHHDAPDTSDSETEEATSDSEPEEDDFLLELSIWAAENNVPHATLRKLLKILSKRIAGLPKDPRTLLRTKTMTEIQDSSGGSYHHHGLKAGILTRLTECPDLTLQDTISLQINVDGLSLFDSNNDQLWPILGLIEKYEDGIQQNKVPFVIGIYYGATKPNSLQFLNDFVEEARQLETDGIFHDGKHFAVRFNAFVCDAPARAMIKNVKGHCAYYGCDKCRQKGLFFERRVTFPDRYARLRSDDDRQDDLGDDTHRHGETILSSLSVGMVTQFPLDYMHQVCLGVTRKMLSFWVKGPPLRTKIGSASVKAISCALLNLRPHIPCEFNRKPRRLDSFENWKATEFRTFLLYTGPVVLKGVIPENLFSHFMLLSVAISILLSASLCAQAPWVEFANEALDVFVEQCAEIYGREWQTYNMHTLVHLSQEAKTYGALDNVSCFPFENFLGQLRRYVRNGQSVLAQVCRRLSEKERIGVRRATKKPLCAVQREHSAGPIPAGLRVRKQFQEWHARHYTVKLSQGDNCVQLQTQDVVLVENIATDTEKNAFIIFKKFRNKEDYFSNPMESSRMGIFHLTNLTPELQYTQVTNILRKYTLLPYRDGFVGFPLLHL